MTSPIERAREAIALAENVDLTDHFEPQYFSRLWRVPYSPMGGRMRAYFAHAANHMPAIAAALLSRDAEVARLREALGKARQEIVDLAGYVPDFDDLPNLLAAIDAALREAGSAG